VPAGQPQTSPASPSVAPPAEQTTTSSLEQSQRIHVVTDLLDVQIDTLGADIRRVALRTYPEKLNEPDNPVVLFRDEPPRVFIAQSGLVANAGQSVDHHARFAAEQTEYNLPSGDDQLQVTLTWQGDNGLIVNKIYTFRRNSFVIGMKVDVVNGTAEEWSGTLYRQLQRTDVAAKDKSRFIYTYTGGIISNDLNKYEKVDFDEMAGWKPEQSYIQGGWVAMIQHYFLGAWIPQQDQFNYFYTKALNNGRYIVGVSSTETKIAPGQTGEFSSRLFVGPKEQDRLAGVAPNLELTVDYGVLTILAEPLFWLLELIHDYIGNWGWSIVLVTLIIKLVFYKLSKAAYTSMANMRKFQPKIQQIRERYGDDRQRMSQAMMDLYKKEKINPLGGCLPMLVQIPVFISLYWVLLESVELRQAPFILWINDLSTKDPYYVLPLIMGASMFLQQKLNPAPMDPMQAKILQFLPIIFTLFFAFFPSGLVLYWVVNNILSIIQQWHITRKIEAGTT
jgi:YidC/Oxa1 family membrane protein insertase